MRRTKSEALETREALLDAAETIFFEKGVSGTSLTDIATAASLTRGAIYWHFADKAALFEAMQERGRLPQEYVTKLLEASDRPDPLELVRQVATDALRYLAANERSQRICAIMLLRCEFVGEMSEILVRMRDADEHMCEAVRAAFRDAEVRGLLSDDWTAETATLAHIATMTGLIMQWLRSERSFDLLGVGEPLMRLTFQGFARVQAPCGAATAERSIRLPQRVG